jgi:hypothetical protein
MSVIDPHPEDIRPYIGPWPQLLDVPCPQCKGAGRIPFLKRMFPIRMLPTRLESSPLPKASSAFESGWICIGTIQPGAGNPDEVLLRLELAGFKSGLVFWSERSWLLVPESKIATSNRLKSALPAGILE